jgi:ribosomal protein L40E
MQGMQCRQCGGANPLEATFCSHCGANLAACPRCGAELGDRSNSFCAKCGAGLYTPQSQQLTIPHVDNTLAWTLAFAPMLGVLAAIALIPVDVSLATVAGVAAFAVNVVLSVLDERRLKRSGAIGDKSLVGWALFLIPVYLYKRARILRQSAAIPVVWCVCFVGSFAVEASLPGIIGVPIDSARAESVIESGILSQTGFSVSVQCPSHVIAKPGNSFQCIASGAGLRAIVNVQVQNSNGDIIWQVQ